MEEIAETNALVDNFAEAVDGLKSSVSVLLEKDVSEMALEYENPLDAAKLFTLVAYAIDSTLFGKFR